MTDKILKFSSQTCGPCKQLAMTLKDENLGVPVEEVDVNADPELAQKFGIRSVPALVYTRNDQEISRLIGAQPLEKIRDWVTIQ